MSLFIRIYKQHFDEVVTQSHESGYLSGMITDCVKLYRRKIFMAY